MLTQMGGMLAQMGERINCIEIHLQEGGGSLDGERDVNPFGAEKGNSQGGFDMRDIPEFEGQMRPDEFVDWLNAVERVFDFREISDERKVKEVAPRLTKKASAWWESTKARRERAGKSKIVTWETMKKELKAKFLPEDYRQKNFIKLNTLPKGLSQLKGTLRSSTSLLCVVVLKKMKNKWWLDIWED